ncbi:MAG: hypothetical protein OXI50_01200 [Gammaproteobacteria bacterium]|nr:hypothetical protein [Gammaproteobacteria bacterium]
MAAPLGLRPLAERYVVLAAPAAAATKSAPTSDLSDDVYRGPIIEIEG